MTMRHASDERKTSEAYERASVRCTRQCVSVEGSMRVSLTRADSMLYEARGCTEPEREVEDAASCSRARVPRGDVGASLSTQQSSPCPK